MTRAEGWARNNPTQAKRRLEWATQSFVVKAENNGSKARRAGRTYERGCSGYSMRSSRMIGNLWTALGINSRSKLPPASVAIEIKKVLATTAAVMLGSG